MSDTLREIESIISRAIFSESREAAFALRDSAVAAIEQIESERDALKSEVERLETLYEAMKREKDDYRAQRDNIRLEADQLSTELHLERFSLKEMNAEIERLKADKARMDWLAALDCDSPLWDALSDTTKLRSTIDAAMKGAE
jgi:chromosome segregation ATPase